MESIEQYYKYQPIHLVLEKGIGDVVLCFALDGYIQATPRQSNKGEK